MVFNGVLINDAILLWLVHREAVSVAEPHSHVTNDSFLRMQ